MFPSKSFVFCAPESRHTQVVLCYIKGGIFQSLYGDFTLESLSRNPRTVTDAVLVGHPTL